MVRACTRGAAALAGMCWGVLPVASLLFAVGCNQKDPTAELSDATETDDVTDSDAPTDVAEGDGGGSPTDSDGGGDDTPDIPLDEQLCPIVGGATWTYAHSSNWDEVQTVEETEYEGEQAFILADTPNPSDNLRADSVHVKRDGRLLRVFKQEIWVNPNTFQEALDASATYGTGFLRCSEAWADVEEGFSESPEYIRIETPAGGQPKDPEDRKHTFTVEGRESVTTSSGLSFSDCVRIRRTKDWAAVDSTDDAQEKLFWFCPGVGKVREENVGKASYEELVDYSIPE